MPADYETPNYTVYFDTNTAYSKKPSDAVATNIVKAIATARQFASVDVRVPEVVLEELIYQQFSIAKAAAENLRKNLTTLMDVCGSAEIMPPTDNLIEIGIRKIFQKVCDENSISKIETPYERIDWKCVVSDSCWRRPPFEKPKSENDLAEKGFRDRMILETVIEDVRTIENGVVAFVSADNLLRSTFKAKAKVKAKCAVEVYSTFDELVGKLKLLRNTKSAEFSKEVLTKIASVFFDPDDSNCVAISQGVLKHLDEEYGNEMSRPLITQIGTPRYTQTSPAFFTFTQPLAATSLPAGDWFKEMDRWTPVSELKFFTSPPIFQSGKGNGRYNWKSTVTLVRLLRRTIPQLDQPYGRPDERIKTKDVDVLWSCQIDPSTAEFSDLRVDHYQPDFRESFVDADWRTRSAYNLPLFPDFENPNG
jgi:hypothetical protein